MIRLCAFSDEASQSLQGQINALKRNGIGLTELRSVDGINVSKLTADRAKEIRKELSDSGISVWSLGSPYGKVPLDESFSSEALFEQLKHLCELCGIFGCGRMRVFSFYKSEGQGERVFDLMRRSVDTASGYGIELYHENEKDIYGERLDGVLELRDNVPGLRFVYDPANFLQAGEPAEKTLDALFDLTSYFHIKDVISQTQQLVPAGYGDGRITDIINKVNADTVFTVEPHLSVFAGYSEIDGREMKNKFTYKNNDEAFDAAVSALVKLLTGAGYGYENGGYVKL